MNDGARCTVPLGRSQQTFPNLLEILTQAKSRDPSLVSRRKNRLFGISRAATTCLSPQENALPTLHVSKEGYISSLYVQSPGPIAGVLFMSEGLTH